MTSLLLAQKVDAVQEFLTDPLLTVACVLLVAVSLAWVVIARLIAGRLRRAWIRAGTKPPPGQFQSPKNIWTDPP